MNGLIVVNKEKNYTSRDVVNVVGKVLNTKKVGHTGTLDPLAQGVLVCVVGKCTKLCDILTCEEKEYIATMKFGTLTDTLDITGNLLKSSDKEITLEEVKKALNHFKGEYLQTVPVYSSVKVNGKRLYEYARKGENVDLPSRMVTIKDIELIDFKDNVLKFKTLVSKGTYIRSLIRDIGEYLDTYGTMIDLIRTKQGDFDIVNSFTLEDIKLGNYKLISLEEIFKEYPCIDVNDQTLKMIKNGQTFSKFCDSKYIVYTYKNELIAVYILKDNEKIKPLILV